MLRKLSMTGNLPGTTGNLPGTTGEHRRDHSTSLGALPYGRVKLTMEPSPFMMQSR